MIKDSIDNLNLPLETINGELYSIFEKFIQNGPVNPVLKPATADEILSKLQNLIDQSGKGPEFTADLIKEVIVNHSVNLHSPMYMAHMVGPSLPLAAMMDLIISGLNQSLAVYRMSPVVSVVEKELISYLARRIGYGDKADGTVTSGGSVSNLLGLLSARNKYLKGKTRDNAVILCSDQSHFSISKSAYIMGFARENIVTLPTDKNYQIDIAKAEEKIKQLKKENRQPFVVSANAGSTSSGSFDNLTALSELAGIYDFWLHVDAAHGGSLIFSDKLKHIVKGLDQADSISWDGHKMLYMPTSLGMCILKDGSYLADCFREEKAPYLYDCKDAKYDLSKLSVQCTRRGDALKLWACLVCYGTDFFAKRLEHLTEVTAYFYKRVEKHSRLEAIHKPEFNIFCFRYNPAKSSLNENELNEINARLRDEINAGGETMITMTVLNGKVCLRVTVINPATTSEHIDRLINIIEDCLPE